jgi:hypothetical protein
MKACLMPMAGRCITRVRQGSGLAMIRLQIAPTLLGVSGAAMALPIATCPARGWLKKARATDTEAVILHDALRARSW